MIPSDLPLPPFATVLERCQGLLQTQVAHFYPPPGWTWEDLWQEATLALWVAWQRYDPTRSDAQFATFATLVIRARLTSAVRRATRQKQTLLNQSVSLDAPGRPLADGSSAPSLADSWVAPGPLLDTRVTDHLTFSTTYAQLMRTLTPFERSAFELRLHSLSHFAIAHHLHCSLKQIDNALQRARRKLQQTISLSPKDFAP